MDVWMIVLRTIFVYFLILAVVPRLGKRGTSQVTLFNLIIGLMIAQLAVISIGNVQEPMLTSLLPVVVLLLLQMLFLQISAKLKKWKMPDKANFTNLPKPEVSSEQQVASTSLHFPLILIKDGILLQDNIAKLGKSDFWLKAELKKRIGLTNFKYITFCSIDGFGHWYIDVKDYLPQK